mgnify:CR=1 FL=1
MSLDAQILTLTAGELADAVRAGRIGAVEAARAYLAQIEATAPRLRAYLRVQPERALAEAAAVDAARARGEPLGPLAGVPYGLKDSFVTAGIETTAGSRILAGWVPPYDCAAARRLRAAGAVLLGKLALDEFGMGATGEHSPWPAPMNPWSSGHVPGGSSSGPAAAVAGRAAAFAIGSDTGGSIRVPAARCGLVGVRPTWGRVSRAGLVAFASSLDAVGPLARDVGDAARVLACLAGQDPEDSTSLADPVLDYPAIAADAAARGLAGVTVGVDRAGLDRAGLDPDVAAAFAAALGVLAAAGAAIVEVALPDAAELLAAYAALSSAEAASNLARYDGVRYGLHVPGDSYEASAAATRAAGFGPEVKRRLVLGALIQRDPALQAKARAARVRARTGHAAALARCDVLASPTTVEPGLPVAPGPGDSPEPTRGLGSDRLVVGASLAGLPALSLPAGFSPARDGQPALPIGLHLVGPPLGEARLLAVAAAYDARAPWRGRVAPGVFPGGAT